MAVMGMVAVAAIYWRFQHESSPGSIDEIASPV